MKENRTISRLAPTPSGFLHAGNILNFLITWSIVRKNKGVLHLRIDDVDSQRLKNEYLDDIFKTLDWLKLDYDKGPSSTDDFFREYSQQNKIEYYRDKREQLTTTYPCVCSRKKVQELYPNGRYHGFCRNQVINPAEGSYSLRLHVPNEAEVTLDNSIYKPADVIGDFIVWRKDDLPSYQLASVIDDVDLKINFIVRGNDLFPSTIAQLFLAKCLDKTEFAEIQFKHHQLLTDSNGQKLSKSINSSPIKLLRESGKSSVDVINSILRQFNPQTQIVTLHDLLEIDWESHLNQV